MAKFWLATFADLGPHTGSPPGQPLLTPTGAGPCAIEVIYEEELDEWGVLFSRVDDAAGPRQLRCQMGYVSDTKACGIWRGRGFPLMEAVIDRPGATDDIVVRSPMFCVPNEIEYGADLISIGGLLECTAGGGQVSLKASYAQSQWTADPVFPATMIKHRLVSWSPTRSNVEAIDPARLSFNVRDTRWPSMAPFKGSVAPTAVWYGDIGVPRWPPRFSSAPPESAPRVDTFGVSAFRFEDVEVLGFRLDLGGAAIQSDEYQALIAPLNFHLPSARGGGLPARRAGSTDFQYRPAARTLNVELLRYGKMKMMQTAPPLTADDYQSQHELYVRVLVGRVDDDAAQAQDPAAYVPAIFVDNPWSKALGRDVQGFDKRLAHFCVSKGERSAALLPNGRLPGRKDPEELASIREVRLATGARALPTDGVLIELDCPYETFSDWDAFEDIDLDLMLSGVSIAPIRWRQTDFDRAEFRRSFARSAMAGMLNSLRSIQVSPIGDHRLREKWKAQTSWITGVFTPTSQVLVARPQGEITLTLHAEQTAPAGWLAFCSLLGVVKGGKGSIHLPANAWYRMKLSLDMTIDDGLE
jgi:hypothetical protein